MSAELSNFICECEEYVRSACEGEPFFKEHNGKKYCVFHYPGFDKLDVFFDAFDRKIERNNFNFQGLWFPTEFNKSKAHIVFDAELDFSYAYFGKDAHFSHVTFLKEVEFSYAVFEEKANFFWTKFEQKSNFFKTHFKKDAWFYQADFKGKITFAQSVFEKANYFEGANFIEEVDFRGASILGSTSFKSGIFHDYVTFDGHLEEKQYTDKTDFDFQYTRFQSPELVSFDSMNLSPSWFVNVDARKFVFTNCSWSFDVNNEIRALERRGVYYPEKLLRISCYQLATNAEENNRYEDASNFRRLALEMQRTEKWENFKSALKSISKKKSYDSHIFKFPFTFLKLLSKTLVKILEFTLHKIYWFTSYYGESWSWAAFVLFSVLGISAFLYTQFYFNVCLPNEACQIRTLNPFEAITHSVSTAILQNPETRKLIGYAELTVTLEKIFAPLQAALLALAIRRKFMR